MKSVGCPWLPTARETHVVAMLKAQGINHGRICNMNNDRSFQTWNNYFRAMPWERIRAFSKNSYTATLHMCLFANVGY